MNDTEVRRCFYFWAWYNYKKTKSKQYSNYIYLYVNLVFVYPYFNTLYSVLHPPFKLWYKVFEKELQKSGCHVYSYRVGLFFLSHLSDSIDFFCYHRALSTLIFQIHPFKKSSRYSRLRNIITIKTKDFTHILNLS